ncbi:malto-oligosyltrehalose trehalohydrolase [Bordetella sp. 02P26C-1]|uniref:malto-oligosyltrehalose trehalohydrolase n=1 Tax=Bordetella sp. 02P26C-1 TaxID=2683195 RepID=UPI001354E9D0|nr:malto-oligosyltrehalose trehalohydrolase [Bordetella sp. 02P26C-1]MVW79878.1 malto-oligosyltrehalose trehalohydrolase [Bordetella sp. 02P26C-1]
MSPFFGATPNPDGSALFRLWAPSAQPGLRLEIAGRAPLELTPGPDGLVEIEVPQCPPGTRYAYRLGDGTRIPDPASRLQDGDVHDESVVVGDEYVWRNTRWQAPPWEQAVIYEVHAGAAGGFDGLRERLPELAALGVNVVELMPIADFPGPRNWGYDGVLPYAPDTAYGSPDALKHLIDCAHGLGIAVMLDVVYNHFGPDGNYLPQIAKPFFREDISTPWGAAIDFRRPEVRRYFEDNACYWLDEYRFDGLRLDAVHAIEADDWLREFPQRVRERLGSRRVYLVIEDDKNRASLLRAGFDAQWNDDGHHVLHHLLTGEKTSYYSDYAEEPAQILSRCLQQGWHYQGQASVFRGGECRGEPSDDLPPSSFIWFLQNHDQTGNRALGERLRQLCDERALCAAIAMHLLSPGIPMIFMGEEVGSTAPFLYFTSHTDEALAEAVRQGRAREFSELAKHADLPDPNAPETFERSLPWGGNGVRRAWIAYYTFLLDLRQRYLKHRLAGARSEPGRVLGPAAVQAHWRLGDGSRLIILSNLGPEPVEVPEPIPVTPYQSLQYECQSGGLAQLVGGVLLPFCTLCLIEERP